MPGDFQPLNPQTIIKETVKGIENILREHRPYVSASECDLCGMHYDWSCNGCDWEATDTNGYAFNEHLLDLMGRE